MAKAYALSTGSLQRINAAVREVERNRKETQGSWYQYRNVRKEAGKVSVVIGKTTARWSKGTRQDIDIYSGNPLQGTGQTLNALSLFADVEAGRWVAILSGYLISAEC